MDKTLDDIIRSKPRVRRGIVRARTARSQLLGKPVVSPASRARATVVSAGGRSALPAPADKIMVSNLPADVNESQIKELFHTTVGPLRTVSLHYDSNGRSTGVASVHFAKKGDGTKAYQKYNSRLIDGSKPMKIEIVVAPATIPLVSRVAPAPSTGLVGPTRNVSRIGRQRSRKERPSKSAADLDAEMEDYTASNGPTSVAAAAA